MLFRKILDHRRMDGVWTMKAQYVHPKRAELTRVLDVPVETLKHEEPLACARYIQEHVASEASALSSQQQQQHNGPLLVHNDSLNEWANQILDNEAAYRLDDGETITVVIGDDEEDDTSSEQDNEARGGIVRVRPLIDDEAQDRSDDGFTIWVRSIEDGSSGGDGRMMKIPPNIEAESHTNDDDDDDEDDETSYDEDGFTICLSSSDSSNSAFTIYFNKDKHKGTSISSVSFSDSISSCSTW